ncbi:tripartite tricarboxylate transporter permease [Virgibacillus necropolis]|uniref:C4-dicarboxylate ABC transporter permease n=1 Tax=Virgibacillus necropolis TaxID=163877 RepID=A0A221MGM5_9BACI|nr:tripartite tricarboxylate transporter permease [Virgibacillus necropolis]ASN06818.1 C4-dicarboxylate ABC transporter permease [Virgibacillus necropolis]
MLDWILYGIGNVFEWHIILAMIFGVAAGIVIGALPGLSATMGVALMLPLTFGMPPTAGMLLLIGIYCGGIYAGSVSAILLKTPGTAASAATVEDGFALAQQGKAHTALNLSIYASVAGGLISGFALLFFAPQIAKVALGFGPPEYFMLALFGLTIISSVSGNSISKGLIMGCLGVLVSTVGLDPITGGERFIFNTTFLLSGIDLVPALIGLFAISEVFNQIAKGSKSIASGATLKKEKFSIKDFLSLKKVIAKSSIIGVIVGAIPGTGGTISAFISYNEAKRSSKKPEEFGKGSYEGIVASESSNNGTTGATLIPMMTLGIPGDVVTAVLLGGLMIQGLTPGPQLFTENADIVYTIMVGFILVNIIMLILAKMAIPWFAKITSIPSNVLMPIVLVLCLIGSYAVNNSLSSVGIAIFFGVIGYFLPKYGYSVTPMLIAIILGPLAEKSLRQSLILSDGSFMIFFQRPISILFLVFCLLSVFVPLLAKYKERRKQNI